MELIAEFADKADPDRACRNAIELPAAHVDIGLFDLLAIIRAGLTDSNWLGFSTEGYVFAAAVYWVFCFSMSRYSMFMERKLDTGHKR